MCLGGGWALRGEGEEEEEEGEVSADLESKELLMDGRWELWSPVIGQGSTAGHRPLVKGDWSQAIGGTPRPIGVCGSLSGSTTPPPPPLLCES